MTTKTKTTLRKVSRGYQITLPPEFREQTGLCIGDHVRIEQQGDKLIITTMNETRQQLANELAAALAEPLSGAESMTDEEAMRIALAEIRKHREAKRKTSPPPT